MKKDEKMVEIVLYKIEQGGQIFIALNDGEVVGCYALKYHDEKQSYELAKMAVSPCHQGKHIGYLLGKTVMEYTRHNGIKKIFLEGDTLEGGVKSIAAYGHTPGHTVFQKDSILVIADLIHGAALQLEYPDYCPAYDMNKEAARESRLRILKYARENNLTMYGMHLPSPGFVK